MTTIKFRFRLDDIDAEPVSKAPHTVWVFAISAPVCRLRPYSEGELGMPSNPRDWDVSLEETIHYTPSGRPFRQPTLVEYVREVEDWFVAMLIETLSDGSYRHDSLIDRIIQQFCDEFVPEDERNVA